MDAGYPVEVTGGTSETLVVDKDSTGRLWVAYAQSSKVMVNHSTAGNDLAWGTPYELPVNAKLTNDDIASIISYNGRIGVMWSSQTNKTMNFAIHVDSDPDSTWQSLAIYAPGGTAADDHMNLKSLQTDGAGTIFAVVKTSFPNDSDPLINLLVCASGTNCAVPANWTPYMIYSKVEDHTRAILLIDTSNRVLNVFSTSPKFGGAIYRKTSPLNNISFPAGDGTPFIQSTTDKTINDATSTKQNVNSMTGLVVLASDFKTFKYLHNYVSLVDASVPTLSFSNANYSVTENGGTATITVNLSKVSNSTVTVHYATSIGTATVGSDYQATSGNLTFVAGQTSQSFTVPITDDALNENSETINLALSAATNAPLGVPSSATLTITDNDNPPSVQFSSATYSVNENAGTATITATLSAVSGIPVTVNYATTTGGSATAGNDYTEVNNTLTFDAGQTSKTFTVPIAQDVVFEGNETVNLMLNDNANVGTPAAATLTIVDDDMPPTVQFSSATYSVNESDGTAIITVLLSNAAGQPVTVNYTITMVRQPQQRLSSHQQYTDLCGW